MLLILLGTLLSTADADVVDEPVVVPQEEPVRRLPQLGAPALMEDRGVGIHAAIGVGTFAVDYYHKKLFMLVGTSLGVALLSDADWVPFVAMIGYSPTITRNAKRAWMFEMAAAVLPGTRRINGAQRFYLGAGLTLGFRYEHRSGFSLAMRLPVFGYEAGPDIQHTPKGVGYFFVTSFLVVAIFSLGYRF